MQENFLHYLWRTRRFDHRDLHTTTGQSLQIHYPGEYNTNAGPDFFNARLSIDGVLWAGNVEIHLQSSEWLAHKHQFDPAYDSVILHVVHSEDQPVLRPDGSLIPCFEMSGRIPDGILSRYRQLESANSWIPCEFAFQDAPEIVKAQWLDRLMIERLEEKTAMLSGVLQRCEQHWEEALYQTIAACFGLKINVQPFESLAAGLPLRILQRHRNHPLQLEALVFGQAGFLSAQFRDAWPLSLQREYHHLANKYSLMPLDVQQWKFFRLRPTGFPTIRLAQFSSFLQQAEHLLSQLLAAQTVEEMAQYFKVTPSEYWLDHYLFERPASKLLKSTSQSFVDLILINAVAPFLFYYGRAKGLEKPQHQAFRLLEQLAPEKNTMLQGWKNLGCNPQNAFQTQSLIQLKNRYCKERRCMECAIGNAILK
ncbi:MAG: DUF2851 family protein [Saprospiraceae bacterium]|nr:DUF2851 family protein [Saprospiraceae bacterium]